MEKKFKEGKLTNAKLIGEEIFPKALFPAAENAEIRLADYVNAERDFLVNALYRHRGILFRGFNVISVEEFERSVEAFKWETYDIDSPIANRSKLSHRVYTANEASPDLFINFHHEMSLRPQPPSKIFFCCIEPSPEGGETAIVASDVIVEKMEEKLPEFTAKVAKVGLIHGNKIGRNVDIGTPAIFNRTWKMILGTDDEVEAEKRAKESLACSSVQFFKDGSAEFFLKPSNPIFECEGKRAWFVPILGYTADLNMVSNKYGDESSDIPSQVYDIYEQILEENCVDIKWEKGDVLLLDNFVVQHARRPGKPPRRVLASMCK